jgi:hypothetical protein
MKNLAHSASFESLDKDAPSKAETKHLGLTLGPPAKPVSGQNGVQFINTLLGVTSINRVGPLWPIKVVRFCEIIGTRINFGAISGE